MSENENLLAFYKALQKQGDKPLIKMHGDEPTDEQIIEISQATAGKNIFIERMRKLDEIEGFPAEVPSHHNSPSRGGPLNVDYLDHSK